MYSFVSCKWAIWGQSSIGGAKFVQEKYTDEVKFVEAKDSAFPADITSKEYRTVCVSRHGRE